MGCQNSTLMKPRRRRPDSKKIIMSPTNNIADESVYKLSKNDKNSTTSQILESASRVSGNHTAASTSSVADDSRNVQCTTNRLAEAEGSSSTTANLSSKFRPNSKIDQQAPASPSTKFDRRHRNSKPSSSAIGPSSISVKIFRCKRSAAKTNSDTSVLEKKAAAAATTNVLSVGRKLSTPIFSTPSIVVDEAPAPPPSAPPHASVSSESSMWDMLTCSSSRSNTTINASADDSQGQQQQQAPAINGFLTKHRFSFGRQRSNEKMSTTLTTSTGAIQNIDSMNDDWVLKIIRCFPFPSPRQSPKSSPPRSPTAETKSVLTTTTVGKTTNLLEPKQFPDSPFLLPTPVVAGPTTTTTSTTTSNASPKAFRFLRQKLSDPSGGGNECKYSALGFMVRRTIETTFPPLIPWDVWLRKRLASWTQCSGHEGTVVPATEKTVWKKCSNDSNEAKAYKKLMDDAACEMAPKFYKEVEHKGECFLELEDLSRNFVNPCIMDVKMGTRTFLECEVEKQTKRADLYEKMITIDPNEPSPSEREEKAITKLRYMTFREQSSSTTALGFRIDAAKMTGGVLQKDFQKVKTRQQITDVLARFIGPNRECIRKSLLTRLRLMREKIEESEFFRTHEVVGSSILIIHDAKSVNAWIIDLAKAIPVDEGKRLDHRTPWQLGNREDGYLFGLDNLIEIIESVRVNESETDATTTEAEEAAAAKNVLGSLSSSSVEQILRGTEPSLLCGQYYRTPVSIP